MGTGSSPRTPGWKATTPAKNSAKEEKVSPDLCTCICARLSFRALTPSPTQTVETPFCTLQLLPEERALWVSSTVEYVRKLEGEKR